MPTRRWPKERREILRLLAAARFYLPKHLESAADLEDEYRESLYYQDFMLALELLERLGEMHAGHSDEPAFWRELYFAAQQMQRPELAEKYRTRLEQISRMPAAPE